MSTDMKPTVLSLEPSARLGLASEVLPWNPILVAVVSRSKLTFAPEFGSDPEVMLCPVHVFKITSMRSSFSIVLMSSWLALLTVASSMSPTFVVSKFDVNCCGWDRLWQMSPVGPCWPHLKQNCLGQHWVPYGWLVWHFPWKNTRSLDDEWFFVLYW